MALEVNSEILLNDVVDNLTADNSIPKRYLQGNAFLGSTYADYYHAANIPNELISTNWLERDSTQYKYPFEGNIFQAIDNIRQQVSNQSLILMFDDLSSMVANAFVPMSNIRVTEFEVALKSKITWNKTCNALLTDSAITDQYNIAENKLVIRNANELIQHGNQLSNWQKVKNDLNIANQYVPENVVNGEASEGVVRLSTLNALINITLSATNYIRTTLSCHFQDGILNKEVQIIYHEKNKEEGNFGKTYIQTVNSLYNYYILNYKVFPEHKNEEMYCWSTLTGQTAIPNDPYMPGTLKSAGYDNIDLYPVFNSKVTYHAQLSNQSIAQYATLGEQYRFANGSVLQNLSSFAAWCTKSSGTPTKDIYPNNISVFNTTENVDLYAIGISSTIKNIPTFNIYQFHDGNKIPVSRNGTKLANIVAAAKAKKLYNMPNDIGYLIAIVIMDEMWKQDSNNVLTVRTTINGQVSDFMYDRMGNTTYSSSKRALYWNSSAIGKSFTPDALSKSNFEKSYSTGKEDPAIVYNASLTKSQIENITISFDCSDNISKSAVGVTDFGYVNMQSSTTPSNIFI